MIGCIDDTRDEEGGKLFTVGHFDPHLTWVTRLVRSVRSSTFFTQPWRSSTSTREMVVRVLPELVAQPIYPAAAGAEARLRPQAPGPHQVRDAEALH